MNNIIKTSNLIKQANHAIVFSGAGISVESGIPAFRGDDGLWSKYDPKFIEMDFFNTHPKESWQEIKKIFYDFMGKAAPNPAHIAVADLEKAGFIKSVITQNIDNLHQQAGSSHVLEYHGTTRRFECRQCLKKLPFEQITLDTLPPECPKCGGLIKPDFVFFSELIPQHVSDASYIEVELSDLIIIVGTTGEVMPACYLPWQGKQSGSTIIEINPEPSAFTHTITDLFLQGKAGPVMSAIRNQVLLEKN